MRYGALVFLIIIGYGLIETTILAVRVRRGLSISASSSAFQAQNPAASYTILVIGDSTGVGTGAQNPRDSVAGRIFRDHPYVRIENLSQNGARMAEVITQIDAARERTYHLILIQAGGNDILRWTDLALLEGLTEKILSAARSRARHVIFMSTGNVGLAPAFFWPLDRIYTARTRVVRSLFMKLSDAAGVTYIDLFRDRSDDPFLVEPHRSYAADFLHPASVGYGYWYRELKRQANLETILSPVS